MSEVVATSLQVLAEKYQPYPEYKDSGVEWLGEIPDHWNVCRIKYVAQLNPSKSEVRGLSDNTIVSFIPMEAIGERGEVDVSRTRLLGDVLTGYSYITDGDVMLAKITPCFENGKGAVVHGLENGIGFATTEVIPARPYRKSDAQFLYYLFTSNPFKGLAEGSMYGAGGQKRVADSFVAEYHFAEAPADERDTIAAFLDYETARIERLIAQQQRLIELLKEKRQAVISHAVTKGLNPNAPMKDSGIEWLGQVPEHWSVGRYKFCNSRIIVGIAEAATHAYVDHGVPLIRSTNIKESGLDCSDVLYLDPAFAVQNFTKKLRAKDIVTVRTGYPGISAVLPSELDNSQCFTNLVATPLPQQESDFLCEYLNSAVGKSYFDLNAWGSAQKNISVPILQNFPVAWPSKVEQFEIVLFCKKTKQKYNRLIDNAMKGIDLLQERRTALISAAVTGKIDLRGWTPPAEEAAA
ncbi:restriction endonuclease subunit S [Aeromonas caviae]|uniref:restriction endonuclease subunit S n=1 Tax=Aeromonas caviae TaxID=648 RepID=UPI0038D0E0D8